MLFADRFLVALIMQEYCEESPTLITLQSIQWYTANQNSYC